MFTLYAGHLPSEKDADADITDPSVKDNGAECDSEGCQADCHRQNDKPAPGTTSPSLQPDGQVDSIHTLPQLVVPVDEERTIALHSHVPPAADLRLPPLVTTQLQEIDFPGSDQESLSSTDGGEESDNGVSRRERKRGFPDLQVSRLPWPTILQYLRESESLASEYFSLKSKHSAAVEKPGVREGSGGPKKEGRSKQIAKDTKAEVLLPGSCSNACEFCGQRSPRLSLLSSGMEQELEGEVSTK